MGPFKEAPLGRRFADDGELKHGVLGDVRRFSKEFYTAGLQRLKRRWKKCVIMNVTLWKDNLTVVKDVAIGKRLNSPITCLNGTLGIQWVETP
jgi:hypothetical protein